VTTSPNPAPTDSMPLTIAIDPVSRCGGSSSRSMPIARGNSPKLAAWATRPTSSSGRLEVAAASTEPSSTTVSTPSITGRRP
jgi:hypothetical protein